MEIGSGLSANLIRIMEVKCISVESLSALAEVPLAIIGDLCVNAKSYAPMEMVLKLAYALEVPIELLLGISSKYVAVASEEEFDSCEIKGYKCLKYHDSRYLSWDINQFPLTPKLSQARRFHSTEAISEFLVHSHYRPDVYRLKPEDFEIVDIEISYKEKANELEGDI